MKYLRALLQAVGGRWLLLPSAVSGLFGLVGVLERLGVPGLPSLSFWALALGLLVPLVVWTIPALLRRVVELEDQLEPKLACEDLQIKSVDGEFFVRVLVRNVSTETAISVKPYLNDIECEDHLREVRELDLPIPLYTQERLRERLLAAAGDHVSVRPVAFSRGQGKWLEVYQIGGLPTVIHLFLARGRAELIPLPTMTFRCTVYGWGAPLDFALVHEESGSGYQIKLVTSQGKVIGPKTPPLLAD